MWKDDKRVQWAWLIALLLVPIVLWILPSGSFDESEVIICPSRLFFGIECFGCGMTRAVMHMHHLEITEAIYYNTAVVVIFPALVIIWGLWVWRAGKKVDLWDRFTSKTA